MTLPLRILAVANGENDIEPVLAELRRAGREVACLYAFTIESVFAELTAGIIDVVICCDWLDGPGVPALSRVLREQNAVAPLLVLSRTGGEQAAVAATKAGADNFLSLDSIERLVPMIDAELNESSRQLVLSKHDEQMRYVLAHAQCLLWSGIVTDVGNPQFMWWQTEVFDLAAAQRFAPIECEPGEPYTAAWYRHRLPEDQARTDHLSAASLRGSIEQYTETFRCRLRDGSIRWFNEQVRVSPLTSNSWMVVGVAVDVTERKQAEERLAFVAEAGTLLSQSLDIGTILQRLSTLCVPILGDMCIVDIVAEDGSLQRMASHHINPDKIRLVHDLERRYPLDPNGAHPAAQAIRTGEPLLVEHADQEMIARTTRDQTHLDIVTQLAFKSYMAIPLLSRGQVLGAITLATTERLRPYNDVDLTLAQEVASHAAVAIENARLYSRAQAAIEVREAFLSVAAHELRTPLTSLLGNAHILERRGIREELFAERDQRNLKAIIAQANRLNRLIELLLDVSRLQRDRLQLDLQPMNLSAVIERVTEEMLPTLRDHTIAVECETGILVRGDELRLEQVLHNLLSNAIKYMPQGGPIVLRLWRSEATAYLTVTDQGIGIPAHEIPRLFKQFYRASNVDPKRISGLGVGLYLIYEVLTRHGGTITVESVEGRGSTFTITLPLLVPLHSSS